MRRAFFLSLLSLLVIGAVAVSHAEDSDQYFYALGFREGYSKGYAEGYRQAWMERGKRDIEILRIYRKQLEAAQAGRYLFARGKITAPEVYQVRLPDGSLLLKVRGCAIKDLEGVETLIRAGAVIPPELSDICALCRDIAKNKPFKVQSAPEWTAAVTPGVSAGAVPGEFVPEAVYRVEVRPEHIAVLDKERVPYISVIEKGKEKYYAVFTDKKVLNAFCSKYHICGTVHVNSLSVGTDGGEKR